MEHITPNYETISTSKKRKLIELTQSSLIHGFNQQDFVDILAVFSRVIERLEAENNEA